MQQHFTLGVYVQVPFCQTKCTYCNFHTGPAARGMYGPYVDAVIREISLVRDSGVPLLDLPVDTVYVGGGTPSLLEPAALDRLLGAIRATFHRDWREVTLEADPETITPEKAAAWRAAGFDRISLGVQSFDDAELKAAGRMHRRADVFAAFEALRGAGFANISADLIAGLPHQTRDSWRASVEELLALGPEHISIYLMEIDESSRLGREVLSGGARYGAANLPDEDSMAGFYEWACGRLDAAGYEHYEISNWARHDSPAASGTGGRAASPLRSRHNMKYWQRAPYLGLGAGAHSFDGDSRWANVHDAAAYVAAMGEGRLPREQQEIITPGAALNEELFLGLRLLDGIDASVIELAYDKALRLRAEDLIRDGLVMKEGRRLRISPSRLSVANEVFVALLNEAEPAG